jgi:RNase P subunit RPR2
MEKRSAKKKEPAYAGNIDSGEYDDPRVGDVVTATIPAEDGRYTVNNSNYLTVVKSSDSKFTRLTTEVTREGKGVKLSNNSYCHFSKYTNAVSRMKFVVLSGLHHSNRTYAGDYLLFSSLLRVDLDRSSKVKHIYKDLWVLPTLMLKYTGKRILDIRKMIGTDNGDKRTVKKTLISNRLNNNLQHDQLFDCSKDIKDIVENIASRVEIPRDDTKENLIKSFISAFSYRLGSRNSISQTEIFDAGGRLFCEKCDYSFYIVETIRKIKVTLTKGKLFMVCPSCGEKYEISFNGELISSKRIIVPKKKVGKKPKVEHIVLDIEVPMVPIEGEQDNEGEVSHPDEEL